ncbi:MAG: hypothetical protein ABIP78_03780 [Pyrinomonadaceae bacterium]
MNKVLFRFVVVLAGAVIFVILFLLGPPILHLLSRFFPETTMPADMSWRVAVTITFVVINLIVYGALGWIVGHVRPSGGWTWGLWIAIFPALAQIAIIFAFDVLYPLTAVAQISANIAGAVAGAHLGAGRTGGYEKSN